MKLKQLTIIALVAFSFCGCSGLTYNKLYLSDVDMETGSKSIQSTEISSASYREGASGITEGSVGGGCGCN